MSKWHTLTELLVQQARHQASVWCVRKRRRLADLAQRVCDYQSLRLQRICHERGHGELIRDYQPHERCTYQCVICQMYLS